MSNVWEVPALRGKERIKRDGKVLHLNQKPLVLMDRIIKAVCIPADGLGNDIVWEPFAGLASASVSAIHNGCVPYAAEINEEYYRLALERLKELEQFYGVFSR